MFVKQSPHLFFIERERPYLHSKTIPEKQWTWYVLLPIIGYRYYEIIEKVNGNNTIPFYILVFKSILLAQVIGFLQKLILSLEMYLDNYPFVKGNSQWASMQFSMQD